MVLCLGELPKEVFVMFSCCIFISFSFLFHFIFDLHLSMFFILLLFFIHISFAFVRHPSPFRGLSSGFYTHFILSAQPITERFATPSFSTFSLSSYRSRYGFEWAFFTHRRFLPYVPSSTF